MTPPGRSGVQGFAVGDSNRSPSVVVDLVDLSVKTSVGIFVPAIVGDLPTVRRIGRIDIVFFVVGDVYGRSSGSVYLVDLGIVSQVAYICARVGDLLAVTDLCVKV